MQYQGVVDSASIRSANNNGTDVKTSSPLEEKLADHKIATDKKNLELKEKKIEVDKQNKANNNKK